MRLSTALSCGWRCHGSRVFVETLRERAPSGVEFTTSAGAAHVRPAPADVCAFPPCSFGGVTIALFSAGGSISKKFGPIASDAGATVRWHHRT